MKKIKEMSLYLMVIMLAFYVLPVLINDTGTGIFFLLILIPIICFLTSLIYGIRHSFNLFIKSFGRIPIYFSKFKIKHNLLISYIVNLVFYCSFIYYHYFFIFFYHKMNLTKFILTGKHGFLNYSFF